MAMISEFSASLEVKKITAMNTNNGLNRLEKYKANHMLFIHDNRVPFDNNMSERDLRKCKNRQKMAGGFRTEAGQKMYCKILSVIETCKRKGESVFGKITEMLLDRPIMAQ